MGVSEAQCRGETSRVYVSFRSRLHRMSKVVCTAARGGNGLRGGAVSWLLAVNSAQTMSRRVRPGLVGNDIATDMQIWQKGVGSSS